MKTKKDLGWKEIVMNLNEGIVIQLTVAGLKKIIQSEKQEN